MTSAAMVCTSIDEFTERVLALVDAKFRGHCQDPDCFELAVVSDTRTSLAYCYWHYWKHVNRAAFQDYDRQKADGLI